MEQSVHDEEVWMGRLFGTDGVRGVANREVTAELALDVSVAAAHVLGASGAFAGHRPRAVVGRDPRVVERKKAGLKKARKAPQYSKR